MILMAEKIVKVLMVAVAVLVLWKLCHARSVKQKLCVLAVCVVLGIFSQAFSSAFSGLTDTVSVKALGERNQASGADELFISNVSIDGKDIGLPKLTEGKWIWTGSFYQWRNEQDTRQPIGTTREILFEVPVGVERSITFLCNEWRGKATVTCCDIVLNVDTYSSSASSVQVTLPQSSTIRQLSQSALRILTFSIVYAVFAMAFYVLRKKIFRVRISDAALEDDLIYTFIKRNKYTILYAVIALGLFIYAMWLSQYETFWYDEIWTIGTVVDQKELFREGISEIGIFKVLQYLWYQIVPSGEVWFYLWTALFSAGGVFLVAQTAQSAYGNRCGLIAGIVAAASPVVIEQCALEVRPYSRLFFFSALTLLLFERKLHTLGRNTRKRWICYGISMMFLAHSHYFGVLVCALLFVADFWLIVKKKLSWFYFGSYIIAGASYCLKIYSLFMSDKLHNSYLTWQEAPSFRNVVNLIKYLASNTEVGLLSLVIGIVTLIVGIICTLRERGFRYEENFFGVVLLYLPIVAIAVIVFNGVFLNPEATLFVNRYFVSLLPYTVILCAYGIDYLCRIVVQNQGRQSIQQVVSIILVWAIFYCVPAVDRTLYDVKRGDIPFESNSHTYESAADWLYTQVDYIYNYDTLVISTDSHYPFIGWKKYYMEQKGLRDSINCVEQWSVYPEMLKQYNRIYVFYSYDYNAQGEIQNILDEEFELIQEVKEKCLKVYTRK